VAGCNQGIRWEIHRRACLQRAAERTVRGSLQTLRGRRSRRHREDRGEDLGKIPRSGYAFSSQPCRTAYFMMSIRPDNPSLRMAFALCASTVLTLSDKRPATSLLL
jgi:hypothetical protein